MKSLQKSTIIFKKSNKNFIVVFATLFLLLLTFCIVFNPQKYIASCYNGLTIWATCVLPSLLPFFVITKLLCEMRSLDKFFNKFSKLNKWLFNAPSCSGYIFGMSIISGYPVGAKLICDFYKKGLIDSDDANKLTTFCSTSGPLFIIGTVGSIMLQNAFLGYVLYIAHILSAILNGILYRKAYKCKREHLINNANEKINYNELLTSSMTSSISSVMIVGGFVAIFFMIIDVLTDLKILLPLIALFDFLFSKIGIENIGNALASGLVEVTRGCKELSMLNLSPTLSTTLASMMIGFGGLSIHAQSLCFLTKCKINTKFYFLQKITQTIFACVITSLLCLIFF